MYGKFLDHCEVVIVLFWLVEFTKLALAWSSCNSSHENSFSSYLFEAKFNCRYLSEAAAFPCIWVLCLVVEQQARKYYYTPLLLPTLAVRTGTIFFLFICKQLFIIFENKKHIYKNIALVIFQWYNSDQPNYFSRGEHKF